MDAWQEVSCDEQQDWRWPKSSAISCRIRARDHRSWHCSKPSSIEIMGDMAVFMLKQPWWMLRRDGWNEMGGTRQDERSEFKKKCLWGDVGHVLVEQRRSEDSVQWAIRALCLLFTIVHYEGRQAASQSIAVLGQKIPPRTENSRLCHRFDAF